MQLAIFQLDASLLRAVVNQVTVGLFALLSRSGDLGGTHQENGFDRGPAHHVDEVVYGILSGFEQIEHGQDKLAIPGDHLGERLRLEGLGAVIAADDVVTFRYRWWLRS